MMGMHPRDGYLEISPRIGVGPDSVQAFGGTLSFVAAHCLSVWLSFGLRTAGHRELGVVPGQVGQLFGGHSPAGLTHAITWAMTCSMTFCLLSNR